MKKLLIITYYWPPSGGAGVQRWLKFAKYLPDFGWIPVIYTPENPEAPSDDHTLRRDIREETIVIRRPIFEPYDLYKRFTGEDRRDKINAGFLTENRQHGFKDTIAAWIRGNAFIPDARKFWIRPSIRFLIGYLRKHPVDAMVSTGPPHSMHLIALGLKKRIRLPWLADFRDPWTNIDYYQDLRLTRWADRKHHKLETKVLSNANCVTSIGSTLAAELHEKGAKQIQVITNGYDSADFESSESTSSPCFTLVHVGAINNDRNHDVFWKALVKLKEGGILQNIDWKVRLVGKVDMSVSDARREYGLEAHVELISYMPHSDVVDIEKQASVLYLPVNNTPNAPGILTGKIFEYLAAQRPVIAIGPVDGDLAELLSTTGAGVISEFFDEEGFTRNLERYIKKFQKGTLGIETREIQQYSRKNLTQKLSDLLNEMCA